MERCGSADSVVTNLDHLVTIIIPCREIDQHTRRCVTMCRLLSPNAHVILVPDHVSAALRAEFDGQARLLESGSAYPSRKRNMAAAVADTAYLALIDDDAYPVEGWPENAVRALQREPEVGSVGGPNISPPDQSLTRRVVGNAARSFLVGGPFAYRKRLAATRDCQHLSSCNLVLRRDDYLRVGGMDESLFTGDDTSLSERIKAVGLRLRFDASSVVFHGDRTLWGAFCQRIASGVDVLSEWKATGMSEYAYYLLSPAFVLFALLGLGMLYFPATLPIYLGIMAIYVLACLVESVRHSRSAVEIPGTLLAIWIGNLGPGIGTLLSLLGIRLPLPRIYRVKSRPEPTASWKGSI